MNTYYDLWLSSLEGEMTSLGGRSFRCKHWSGVWEEGYTFRAPDGPVKLVVLAPERVQKGHLMARGMQIVLHYPAARKVRPLSLCYGEPKSVDDAKGAVLNLLVDVRKAIQHQTVIA